MIKNSNYNENNLLLPKVDFIFKKIFGEEKNKELLQDFLANIFGLPKEKITGLTLTNSELLKEYEADRKGYLDVRVEMDDENEPGKKVEIDVEIQLKPHDAMLERILFYWSKMFVQPFDEGMPFGKLRKTVSIIIFDETYLPIEKYHSKFHLWEDEERYKLGDVLEIHMIELQKAMKFVDTTIPAHDGLLNWLLFLSNNNSEVCDMLSTQSAVLDRAVHEQRVLSRDRQLRMYYDRRLVEETDALQHLYDAERRGMARGMERGMAQSARNMLKLGFDIPSISSVTGLSESEIHALQ